MCRLSAGVFVLLQVYAFLQYLKNRLTRHEFQTLFFLGVSVAAGVVFLSVIYLTYTGWFHTFTGPIKKTPKQEIRVGSSRLESGVRLYYQCVLGPPPLGTQWWRRRVCVFLLFWYSRVEMQPVTAARGVGGALAGKKRHIGEELWDIYKEPGH